MPEPKAAFEYYQAETDVRTKLRLRAEAIEQERKERGWTQDAFVNLAGISKRRYQIALKETREGSFPNLGMNFLDGICNALGWSITEAAEQVVID